MVCPSLLKDPEKKAKSIIKKITHSGELELNKEYLSELKGICKSSGDELMFVVYKECMKCLSKAHSQVRVSSVRLIDYLFQKSHIMRERVLDHFDSFLELTLAISQQPRIKLKLPPPKKYAALLQESSAKIIHIWHSDFGAGYEKIRYAYKFLREHQLVDFSAFRVRTHEDLIKRQQLAEKQAKILTRSIENRMKEFQEVKPEIEQLIAQIQSLIDMITTTSASKDFFHNCDGTNPLLNESGTSSAIIKGHQGVCIANFNQTVDIEFSPFIEIRGNSDNKEIVKSIKELKKELVVGKLTKVIAIEKTIAKRSEQFVSTLREIIDLKSKAMNLVLKLGELKIVDEFNQKDGSSKTTMLIDSDSEENSDFEDVNPKEGLETYIPKSMRVEYGLEAIDPKELHSSNQIYTTDLPGCSSKSLGALEIAISCNVKLDSGKLCPRRDKLKCPFHGKIIPRDHNGVPLNDQDRLKEERSKKKTAVPDWQDPEFLQDIRLATGVDLTLPKKGRSKCSRETKLANIRTCDTTAQQRLRRRLKQYNK